MRGEMCPYSHGVFESWLHPSRYRTQLCKDGTSCSRPLCFFAHSLPELRAPTHTWAPTPEDLQPRAQSPFALQPAQRAASQPTEGPGSPSRGLVQVGSWCASFLCVPIFAIFSTSPDQAFPILQKMSASCCTCAASWACFSGVLERLLSAQKW